MLTELATGDTRVLDAARQQIRGGFREKASLPSSDPSTAAAIQHAQEVAAFLKSNVVQGKKEGEDLYRKFRIHLSVIIARACMC